MKLIKRIIALIMIVSTLVLSSCSHFEMNPYAGMRMDVDRDGAYILGYEGNAEIVYFPSTYKNRPVKCVIGIKDSHFIGSSRTARFEGPNLKRIYFPWQVHSYDYENKNIVSGAEVTCNFPQGVTVIFTACDDIIYSPRTVIPLVSYNQYIETGKIGYTQLLPIFYEIIPANIAYMFNYPDAPNENYFFIDLVERKRNARLTEPPYIPEREGYVFEGWYKEEECINAWDFETDFVEIKAEKGKQIYEEIRLYAKWAPVS